MRPATGYPFESMLELPARPWLYSLSQKYQKNLTKLEDIPDEEFELIKHQGFSIVWLMGVWKLGQYGLNFDRNSNLLREHSWATKDDIIGSPYAVVEYTCNPELGSDGDLKRLKKKLNDQGIELMLDFVPNHTAVDCAWTQAHPNWYARSKAGAPVHPNVGLSNGIIFGGFNPGDWKDTGQLNYWNPELRKAQIENILKICSCADMIRCDMAHLILNDFIENNWIGDFLRNNGFARLQEEFWSEAFKQVKKLYPNVQFLAEVYDPWTDVLQRIGFDWTYDKRLYDLLVHGHLDQIRTFLYDKSRDSGYYHQHSARFIENHDEPRAVQVFGSPWRANAAALVCMTLPGLRFYFMDQMNGFKNRLAVHMRRGNPEPSIDYVQDLYKKLVPITTHEVFMHGEWAIQPVYDTDTCWRLLAWTWMYKNERRLCVLNYSDEEGQGKVILPYLENSGTKLQLEDLLTNEKYERDTNQIKKDGLYVIVPKWWAQIFKY